MLFNSMCKLTKHSKKAADHTIPTFHGPEVLVFIADEEKANVLDKNFKKFHHLTDNMESEDDERRVREICNNIKQADANVDEINFVSPKEEQKSTWFRQHKTKNLTQKYLVQLTNIYNACFRFS